MCEMDSSWRLPVGLRLLTLPVSIVPIVAFSHVIAWHPVDASWGEWGIMYLEESAFLPVCPVPSFQYLHVVHMMHGT